MIIASAVKLDTGKVYIGNRHGDCYSQIESFGLSLSICKDSIQGFITDELVFLDREQAYYHAFASNQCEEQTPIDKEYCLGLSIKKENWKPCLISEHLW